MYRKKVIKLCISAFFKIEKNCMWSKSEARETLIQNFVGFWVLKQDFHNETNLSQFDPYGSMSFIRFWWRKWCRHHSIKFVQVYSVGNEIYCWPHMPSRIMWNHSPMGQIFILLRLPENCVYVFDKCKCCLIRTFILKMCMYQGKFLLFYILEEALVKQ